MAASMRLFLFLCIFCAFYLMSCAISLSSALATASPSLCPRQSEMLFLESIYSQCPLSYFSNPPIEVDGSILDRALTSKWQNTFTSVLFYASWCPFSKNARLVFEALSSMFPEIEHWAIEESSAMPSIFSRCGVHSFPTILMVNSSSSIRFHESKDLESLVKFYKKTTGLQPVQYIVVDHRAVNVEGSGQSIIKLWGWSSLNEMITREPYILLSISFLCLRLLLLVLPRVLSCLKSFWESYQLHLSLKVFGEASQISGRVLQMIDLKKIKTKLGLCKTRKFQQSAKNARVWASSLASVSLGETSSSKSSS